MPSTGAYKSRTDALAHTINAAIAAALQAPANNQPRGDVTHAPANDASAYPGATRKQNWPAAIAIRQQTQDELREAEREQQSGEVSAGLPSSAAMDGNAGKYKSVATGWLPSSKPSMMM